MRVCVYVSEYRSEEKPGLMPGPRKMKKRSRSRALGHGHEARARARGRSGCHVDFRPRASLARRKKKPWLLPQASPALSEKQKKKKKKKKLFIFCACVIPAPNCSPSLCEAAKRGSRRSRSSFSAFSVTLASSLLLYLEPS